MKFTRHSAVWHAGRTLVLSQKAQMVLATWLGSDDLIREFARLRDNYMERRTTENINRITTFEIESMGLDAALNRVNKHG